jgi:DNA repair ATPase RecN
VGVICYLVASLISFSKAFLAFFLKFIVRPLVKCARGARIIIQNLFSEASLTIQVNQVQYLCMSENPTQPTLKTIMDAVNAIGVELHQFRTTTEKRLEKIEARLDKIEIRMDRIESMALETRADLRELRAEFTEFRSQFKQPA